jgi:hypothetical protein
VTSKKKTRKSASAHVVGYDPDKRRYYVRLTGAASGANDFLVKEKNMVWHCYGDLPQVPHFAAVYFSSLIPPFAQPAQPLHRSGRSNSALTANSSTGTPLGSLLTLYESSTAGSTNASVADFLFADNCKVALALLDALEGTIAHRQCTLATSRALAEISLYRGLEDRFITQLVAHYVNQEIAETPQLSTLFRSNSTASRILSAFVATSCRELLLRLQVPLKALIFSDAQHQISKTNASNNNNNNSGSGNTSTSSGNLNSNNSNNSNNNNNSANSTNASTSDDDGDDFTTVAVHANAFLDAILACESATPHAMRRVLLLVGEAAEQRFADEPNARDIALGGVVFLRFFGPALLSPLEYGLVDAPVSPSVQRILVLTTSAITVLANQTSFSSSKPTHVLNDTFVNPQRARVQSFLEKVNTRLCGLTSFNANETMYRWLEFQITFSLHLRKCPWPSLRKPMLPLRCPCICSG